MIDRIINNNVLYQDSKLPVCSCAMCQGKTKFLASKPSNNISTDYQIAALDSTWRWPNAPKTITYSFFSTGSTYYGSESVSEVSAAIKSNARTILEQIYEPYINVDFVEVPDSSSSYGQIRFMFSSGPGYAYAYYPGSHPLSGDVHFTSAYETNSYNAFSGIPGTHGFASIIHEVGHALGLKHPGDYNNGGESGPYLPYDEDNTFNTVMSYNFPSSAPGYLMPYDLKTLQSIYGAKPKNSTDTTYTFTNTYSYSTGTENSIVGNRSVKILLYDTGGVDTLNFANLAFAASGYRFDMRENGAITDQSVYNARSYQPYGKTNVGTYYTSTYGTKIAYGSSIENLVNSTSNDYIIANSLANTFSGYNPTRSTGNDMIEAANQSDRLDLSNYTASGLTQTQNGNNLVLGLATNRNVTLVNYFAASQPQRLQIQVGSVILPTLTIGDVSITEGNVGTTTNANFIVSLSNSSSQPVTLQYATAPGSATAPSDYTAITTTTLTFNPTETTKTISVAVSGDNFIESDETFLVNLANATGAILGDAQAIGNIVNDDVFVPAIIISDVSITEGNIGTTNANFVVSLTGATTAAVEVQYNTTGGSATPGSDYSGTTAILTFNPGETSKTIAVAVQGDTLTEANERFFANLTSATNSTITTGFASATIINDDILPRISVSDRSLSEGNTGTTNADFLVTLSSSSTSNVTVNYLTGNYSAAAGSDYNALSGIVTFLAGETAKTISTQVRGDVTPEADERFFFNLSTPVGGTIYDGLGVGTILNDENPLPTINITDTSVIEGNSGTTTANFIVSLNSFSASNVTVNYSSANYSAAAGSDYEAIPTTSLTFLPGETIKTISTQVRGDLTPEGNERFVVGLTGATNATFSNRVGVATILNDDTLPNSTRISVTDSSITEGDTGTKNANFVVSLNSSSGQLVTLNYNTTNYSALAGSDYDGIPTTSLSFNPGETAKTISVTVRGDVTLEGNERFFLNLTNAVGGTFVDRVAVGTILEDDNLPRISITDTTIIEGNTGKTSSNFVVSLSETSAKPVTVNYRTTGNTASAGADFDSIPTTSLTFNPGETAKTISVQVRGDLTSEANERFLVPLTTPINGTIYDNLGVGTILNDDNTPSISITDTTVAEGSTSTTANFIVSLNNTSSSLVTVAYATSDGNASAPGDYLTTNGLLTFNPGETSKTITVGVAGDLLTESNERFLVNLTNAVGGTLVDSLGVGTIQDFKPAGFKPQSVDLLSSGLPQSLGVFESGGSLQAIFPEITAV